MDTSGASSSTAPSWFPKTHSEIQIDQHHRYSHATTMDASGASSSSTAVDSINSSSVDYRCGVFINRRGPDTKKTFASYLYRRLLVNGLRPFLHQEELEVGSNFPTQIVGAIRSASVHVAIFSPTYAISPWCLRELVLMLESKAPIIPIFYHVDPAALRWTDQKTGGVYVEALHKLQMKKTREQEPRYDCATLQKWRKALSDVAEISGFDLMGKFNGDEGLLLDEVVKRVVKIMAKKMQLYVAKNPTGLDDKVADFETTVFRQQNRGEVQVVGIVGLGGVGKTTLAKVFFNRKRSEYSKSYFLSDVGENAKISLHSLQSKLLFGLFHLHCQIDNIHQCTELLTQLLSSSKIFLILDDIDHVDQVDALLPNRNALQKDSLILLTSRDEGVLARAGVEESSMYKLTGLPYQHSHQLFCLYAFCQPYPPSKFYDLVNKFVMACDGLPLSLIVFGALLSGYDDESEWEAILHELKLPDSIKFTLKVSYDALSQEEQQIFLDIACFFIGKRKNSAITLWDESGFNGLSVFQNLQHKGLVKLDDEDVILMNNHLRNLGREIAECELPRRLCCPDGNINDWLHQLSMSVLREARGITMVCEEHSIKRMGRSYQRLGKLLMNPRNSMYNKLHRFLGSDVMNFQIVETRGHLLDHILRVPSRNFIWFSWLDCPYTRLPSWITIKNLRILRVEGIVLETLWQGKLQAPLQLMELEIINASRLSSIPKSIGQLKHLQRIVIYSSFLPELPEEFGYLNSLRTLVLNAGSLKSLPNSLGKLTNLHYMDLSQCEKLQRLPDSCGSLTNLHHMDLRWCQKLERLPDSFGGLTNLHHIDLGNCQKLKTLPDSFGNLRNLHHINMSECEKLKTLPDSFGNLRNLHHMNLSECEELERLPDSFGSLSKLHHMDLGWCEKLERLPNSFGYLTNLHHLNLRLCKKLGRLPDSFCSLTNLRHMDLSMCEKLERLPDSFRSLTNLHHISLVHCTNLERLPDSFGSLSSLKYFNASFCSNLTMSSETFGNIRTLEHIDLTGCEKVEVWPSQLAHQRSLKILKLRGTIFKELLVAGCLIIQTAELLCDEVVYSNLRELVLEECINVVKVGTLPKALTRVELRSCYNLTSTEGLCGLALLRELRIEKCKELPELPSVNTLVSLESLIIIDCVKLKSIRDLALLTELRELNVRECPQLEEIEGVEDCKLLRYLYVGGCPKLRLGEEVVRILQQRCTVFFHCEEPNQSQN